MNAFVHAVMRAFQGKLPKPAQKNASAKPARKADGSAEAPAQPSEPTKQKPR